MDILYLIPARAGSKGLPGKNTKLLKGKPLISYSIEFALSNIKNNDELCISTNDKTVIEIAEQSHVNIPFVRPEDLASDTATTHDVILHALGYYKQKGKTFDAVFLLQPTSPFRIQQDFDKMMNSFDGNCDMVVTVRQAKDNPYFNLFEEDGQGLLRKSKEGAFERRQDCPPVFAYNGSMYLFKTKSIEEKKMNEFSKIKKVLMPERRSIDIDTPYDWMLAEMFFDEYNKS